MKIMLTGAKGQLGYDIAKVLEQNKVTVIKTDIDNLDITDKIAVEKFFKTNRNIDAIIHCAAYTDVDAAKDNVDLCRKINVYGTENLAKQAKKLDIKMMYFSTDYVFDGKSTKPLKEEDKKLPLNVYGKSKYDGELIIKGLIDKYFILRVSWLFGINGNNFVKKMLEIAKEKDVIKVVDDQIGTPTYTYDLAKLVEKMIRTDKFGVYHVSNEGQCSRYEFACEIFDRAQVEVNVLPIKTSQLKTKEKRPSYTVLSKEKLCLNGFDRLPNWRDALNRYLKEL